MCDYFVIGKEYNYVIGSSSWNSAWSTKLQQYQHQDTTMASSHKIIALCICLILASSVFIVEGQGFSGMLGGGGGKHGSNGIELLLAAGLLGKILSRNKHHHHGHHHHGHHHEGRSASGPEYANAMPYAGFEAQQPMHFMPFGFGAELGQEFAGFGGWQ